MVVLLSVSPLSKGTLHPVDWVFLTSVLCTHPSVLRSPGVLGMKVRQFIIRFDLCPVHIPPKKVDFALSHESSLAHANPYYPLPVPSPPWVHPSPSSDTTPPTNSPPSLLSHHATVSPPAPTEPLPTKAVKLDAHITEELTPQSPPATRNTQAAGRRPGACSRCKKLKVCASFPSACMPEI